MSEPTTPRRRWVRFAVIWAAVLVVIWWSAANITMKFAASEQSVYRTPNFKLLQIDDPQPPTPGEIVFRGSAGTFLAIFGWAYIRYAMRRDEQVESARRGHD